MRVIFVRHGESQSNSARDVVALPEAEGDRLTELGRRQAAAAGAYLAGLEPPDLLLTSPMRRARETGDVLAEELGGSLRRGLEPSIRELAESSDYTALDVGDQVEQRWARRMAANPADPLHAIGDGESFADLVGRVRTAKRRLEGSGAERVIAVSHGIFLRFFLLDTLLGDAFSPAHAERLWQLGSANCGLCVFEHRPGGDEVNDPALDAWRAGSWMCRPWDGG